MRGKACPQSKKAGSWWQRSHQTREAVSPREPAPLLTCWWQVHPHNMSFGSLWPPLLGGHLNSHSRSCANEPCSSCLLTSPGAQRPRGPSPTTLMPPAPCMTTSEPQLPTRLFGELPRRTCSQAPACFLPLIPRKQFLSLFTCFSSLRLMYRTSSASQ